MKVSAPAVYTLQREGSVVFEVRPVLLRIAEAIDDTSRDYRVFHSLVCLGFDIFGEHGV